MKRLNKLAAAVAVALSVGGVPQVNALVELKANGRADALLFPVFNGYLENYFTVENTDNNWIQAHIRFRGAAWSGELLDFDVILSPGDVFVFRMADVDGDGYWEVDQSVDPNNFKWAGMLQMCGSETNGVQGAKTVSNCIDQSTILMPDVDAADNRIQYDYTAIPSSNYPAGATQSQKDEIARKTFEHQRHVGYIEVIGEGIFLDLAQTNDQIGRYVPTHELMERLANPVNRGKLAAEGQREVKSPYDGVGYGQLGTSLWSWVDAQNAGITDLVAGAYGPNRVGAPGYHRTRIAKDVGNSLGGTAFITLPGQSQGVAYNAEALVNFRTTQYSHRIENYPLDYPTHGGVPGAMPRLAPALPVTAAEVSFANITTDGVLDGRAVIIHDENSIGLAGGLSPIGDYVYTMMPDRVSPEPTTDRGEDRQDESRISFNNTWGPTLADGDDTDGATLDPWDVNLESVSPAKYPPHDLSGRYVNSISEIESAIEADGQDFSTFYFDGRGLPNGQGVSSNYALHSLFFAYFPTKFYYGERPNYYLCNKLLKTDGSCGSSYYLKEAVRTLLSYGKPVAVEIWDTDEHTPTAGPTPDCPQSPCLSSTPAPSTASLGSELTLFNVAWIKSLFSGAETFDAGRISVRSDNSSVVTWGGFTPAPFLLYTLETMNPLSNPDQVHGISNWRSMHR